MNKNNLIIFVTVFLCALFLRPGIADSQNCVAPSYQKTCGYCDGIISDKEASDCHYRCINNEWAAVNEEYVKCTNTQIEIPVMPEKPSEEIQQDQFNSQPAPLPQKGTSAGEEPSVKKPSNPPKQTIPEEKLFKQNLPEKQLPEKEIKPSTAFSKEVKIKNLTFGKDIKEGDTVKGEAGLKTIIRMPNGSMIVIREGSEITFRSETSVENVKGFFRFLIKLLKTRTFTIRTTTAAGAVRGTEFLVESDEEKTIFNILEGNLEVSDLNFQKKVEVNSGNEVTIEKGKLPSNPKPIDLNSIDRWYEDVLPISAEQEEEYTFPFYYLFAAALIIGILFIIRLVRGRLKKPPTVIL